LFPKSILADGCCSVEKKQNCKPQSWWSKGWGTTVFSGILTSQTSSRIIQKADFGDSGIAAIAVSKELVRFFNNRLGFEYEGQAVQHFGDQDHFELNPAILVARWWSFPWNKTLPTTIAIGDGVSIATRTPNLERERRGKETSKVLNFVMAEITLSNPCYPIGLSFCGIIIVQEFLGHIMGCMMPQRPLRQVLNTGFKSVSRLIHEL